MLYKLNMEQILHDIQWYIKINSSNDEYISDVFDWIKAQINALRLSDIYVSVN